MYLQSLHLYPIKSCGGVSAGVWEVERRGLRYDRRWMVVSGNGRFVSQREHPRLALVRPRLEPPHLVVDGPGISPLILALEPLGGARGRAQIWGDDVAVWFPAPVADRWFTQLLGVEVRLAYLPDESTRALDPDYAPDGGQTAFADGFPFLLIGQASLDDLNGRLEQPLPVSRFRPNLVVQGSAPFAEDGWRRIGVGEVEFDVVKPCDRCVLTTIDQGNAQRGVEPLQTLATFRRRGGKVLFGQNLVHRGPGVVRVGDTVRILSAVEQTPR